MTDFEQRHAGEADVADRHHDDVGYIERRKEIMKKLAASVVREPADLPRLTTQSAKAVRMGPPPPPAPPPI